MADIRGRLKWDESRGVATQRRGGTFSRTKRSLEESTMWKRLMNAYRKFFGVEAEVCFVQLHSLSNRHLILQPILIVEYYT